MPNSRRENQLRRFLTGAAKIMPPVRGASVALEAIIILDDEGA